MISGYFLFVLLLLLNLKFYNSKNNSVISVLNYHSPRKMYFSVFFISQ